MLEYARIRVWTLVVQGTVHHFPEVSARVKEVAVALASRPAARQNSTIKREILRQSAIQRLQASVCVHITVPVASQFLPVFIRWGGCLVEVAPIPSSRFELVNAELAEQVAALQFDSSDADKVEAN